MGKRMHYRMKILRSLYPYAGGVKKYWGLLMLFSLLVVGLEFSSPVIYRILIDDVILGADLSMLKVVVIGYLAIYVLSTFAGYVKVYSKRTLVNTVLYRVRKKILNNFLDFTFPEYETASIGDMKMRIDDDTNQINEFAGKQTVDYVIACITIVASTIMLLSLDWVVAGFAIMTIPVTFWFDNILSKHEKIQLNERRENLQKMSSWLRASVQGWREVKALNLSKHETRTFYGHLHTDMLFFAKWINYWTARVLIIPKIKDEFFMQFGLYLIGGLLILNGKLGISDLLVLAVYYSMLADAIKAVSTADADLQSGMPYTDRLLESLESAGREQIAGRIPDDANTIVLKDVAFTYPNAELPVLTCFNLTIGRGERLAITGKSGSGKTTLLKLITGMLQPTEGVVSFSGIDLREIDMEALHTKIGFVMQENILFHTSIRENLLYGKKSATAEELREACKKACIYDFIKSLPEEFDTVIGEKGIKLSGGQRQRIVLARLFLRDADIFIFDEATSALDQYSENIIQDAIENISRDKTVIVVAHRESSIRVCDRKITVS